VELHVDATFGHLNAFGFEKFSLKGSIRFTDQKPSPCTKNTMPGNAFAGRAAGHGSTRGTSAAGEAQSSRDGPIR
jgi:hypothetical protein